jgi:ankyrin repeat protein
VIFVLIGLILYLQNRDTLLDGRKWGLLFAVYFIALLARLLCFALLAPALRGLGCGMSWQEAAVSIWGGLRGAVGLALAVGSKHAFGPDPSRQQVYKDLLFYVSGIVLLTLTVNGTTMARLVQRLKLDGVSALEFTSLASVRTNLQSQAARCVSSLKRDPLFSGADFDSAGSYCPAFELPKCNALLYGQKVAAVGERCQSIYGESRLKVEQRQLAKIVRGSYMHSHHEGTIGDVALGQLLTSAAVAIEEAVGPMADWATFKRAHSLGSNQKRRERTCRDSCCRPLEAVMSGHLPGERRGGGGAALQFELLAAFIIARKEAMEHVTAVTQDPAVVAALREECILSRHAAGQVLHQLSLEAPDVHRAVQTAAVAKKVLYDQRRMMEAVAHEGVVEEGQKEKFVAKVEAALKAILARPPQTELPEEGELLRKCGWVTPGDDDIFQRVMLTAERVSFGRGERLFGKGTLAPGALVLISGVVDCDGSGSSTALFVSAGSTVGLRSVLAASPMPSAVTALEPVRAFRFSAEALAALGSRYSELESSMWRHIGGDIAHEAIAGKFPFKSWPAMKLSIWLERAEVRRVPDGERVTFTESVVVILKGEAQNTAAARGAVALAPSLLVSGAEADGAAQGFVFKGGAWVLSVRAGKLRLALGGGLAGGTPGEEEGRAKSDVNVVDHAEELIQAGFHGDIEKAQRLLKERLGDVNDGDYDRRTALHLACAEGHAEMVRFLLDSGANANAQDRFGRTPLEECVLNKHDAIADVLRAHGVVPLQGSKLTDQMLSKAKEGDLDGIKRLVDNGASVNTADYDLRTALHIAAAEGQYQIVEYLLLRGAMVNAEDRMGNTPLVDAMANAQAEVCALLQRNGAKKLDRAAHIAAMCQAAGAGDLRTLNKLISSGTDVNAGDYDYRTPLHIAASMGQVAAARLLVKAGAWAGARDRWQNTPLDDSVRGGFGQITALLRGEPEPEATLLAASHHVQQEPTGLQRLRRVSLSLSPLVNMPMPMPMPMPVQAPEDGSPCGALHLQELA